MLNSWRLGEITLFTKVISESQNFWNIHDSRVYVTLWGHVVGSLWSCQRGGPFLQGGGARARSGGTSPSPLSTIFIRLGDIPQIRPGKVPPTSSWSPVVCATCRVIDRAFVYILGLPNDVICQSLACQPICDVMHLSEAWRKCSNRCVTSQSYWLTGDKDGFLLAFFLTETGVKDRIFWGIWSLHGGN